MFEYPKTPISTSLFLSSMLIFYPATKFRFPLSKLKKTKNKCDSKTEFDFERVEKILGKEGNASNKGFLLFSSTGRRPASYCHGVLSVVRRSVRPYVCPKTFLLKTLP